MDGMESSTELLASVSSPGFSRVAANDLATVGDGFESPRACSGSYFEPYCGSSSSDREESGWEDDDEDNDGAEPYPPPPNVAEWEDGHEDDDGAEPYPPPPNIAVDGENLDAEGYTAAAGTFASEMQHAAAPEEQNIYVPPESLYLKRKRTPKGVELPTCRPPREVGVVEVALRASASKSTTQIFYPKPGLVFDSVEEAYEFYNLYSWEVGFDIRYGRSNTNKGNNYRTKQFFECGNAGEDKRCKYQSQRCQLNLGIPGLQQFRPVPQTNPMLPVLDGLVWFELLRWDMVSRVGAGRFHGLIGLTLAESESDITLHA